MNQPTEKSWPFRTIFIHPVYCIGGAQTRAMLLDAVYGRLVSRTRVGKSRVSNRGEFAPSGHGDNNRALRLLTCQSFHFDSLTVV